MIRERSTGKTASRGAFEFAEPMTVDAKGKTGGVACRRLVRSLSLMRPRGVQGLRRAFVGRDAEFERLVTAYRGTIEEARPKLITIVGDAGVGKTRLVRELWDRLADELPEPLVHRCPPLYADKSLAASPSSQVAERDQVVGRGLAASAEVIEDPQVPLLHRGRLLRDRPRRPAYRGGRASWPQSAGMP